MASRYEEIMRSKNYLPYRMDYLTDWMVKKAEEELGETEEVKARTIPELRKLVEAEPKLVCPTDDAYMIQFLRARKYNVKKAFALLQNYYRVKITHRDLYDALNVDAFMTSFREEVLTCLPYRDQDGCVIYIIKIENWNTDIIPMSEGMVALTAGILFCVEDAATQICGVRIILNVRGATLKQIRSLTPRYMTLFSKALRNCLPVRFKGIHLYNESFIFAYFWSIFRLFLSDKIRNRVHFHGDSQKHLHKAIPKAILPAEYGGDCQLSVADWYNNELLTNFLGRFRELMTYGYRRD